MKKFGLADGKKRIIDPESSFFPVAIPEDISRLSQELERFGLTRTAAKVYVALLVTGGAPANKLAKITGVHRVDVYKRLEELLRLGFVSVKLGRPSAYVPADPKFVLGQITEVKRKELDGLAEAKDWLLAEFTQLRRNKNPAISEGSVPVYQLIVGRRKGYDDAKQLVHSAQDEILRVVSSNGLTRNYNFDVLKEYKACAAKGVRIRIVSDLSKVPRRVVRFCVDNFEVRHSSESTMRLLIVDRKAVLLSAVFNDTDMTIDSMDDRYLLIKDDKIAKIVALLFEHLWTSSLPAEKLL